MIGSIGSALGMLGLGALLGGLVGLFLGALLGHHLAATVARSRVVRQGGGTLQRVTLDLGPWPWSRSEVVLVPPISPGPQPGPKPRLPGSNGAPA